MPQGFASFWIESRGVSQAALTFWPGPSVVEETLRIQLKKPKTLYNLYQEGGFLQVISEPRTFPATPARLNRLRNFKAVKRFNSTIFYKQHQNWL